MSINITNIDLDQIQLKEIEEMIEDSKENLGKRCDLMLILSDGLKVLLIKRDSQIVVQTMASLEM